MDSRDLSLVRRVLAGDADAFEGIVAAHTRSVYNIAYRVTGNPAAAEDAVQETFLRAFRFLGRFDQRAELGTWLHRIAVNAAIDQTRRSKRERLRKVELPEEGHLSLAEIPTGAAGPERQTLDAEIRRRTEAALSELSASERAAFVLRHYEGRSIAEISSALGKRDNATKQSIFRAVRKLRVALAPLAHLSSSLPSQESFHEEPA
ncbi:MAG: sigma-70 family RNA polymerase sigma factor [Thermoanaerobaculia bacterium]